MADELTTRLRSVQAERLRPIAPPPPRGGDTRADAEAQLAYLRDFYRHDTASTTRLRDLMAAIGDKHIDQHQHGEAHA